MVCRQRVLAATALVSTLALATAAAIHAPGTTPITGARTAAAVDAPGATPITGTRTAVDAPGAAPITGTRTAAVQADPADDRRPPPARMNGGGRHDGVVEVQSRGANVRVEPALDAPVITTVSRGCLLPVLARSDGWVGVALDGDRVGWIHGPLVAPTAVGAGLAAEPLGPLVAGQGEDPRALAAVRVPHANVREGPATTAAVVTTRQGGCLLPVLAWQDGWVRIRLDGDGGTGWVQNSLVTPAAGAEEEEVAQAAAAPAPPPPSEMAPADARAPGPSSGPPRSEPLRVAAIEPAPAPSPERIGAGLAAAPATAGGGVREPSSQPPPPAGLREEHGSATTEPGRPTEGGMEAAAEPPEGGADRVQRSGAHPASSATAALGRTEAMAAPQAAAAAAIRPPEGDAPDRGSIVTRLGGNGAPEDEKLRHFRTKVEHINERVRRAVGVTAFAKIEDLGGGAVALTATDVWLAAPEAARRTNLESLARFWGLMHDPDAPVGVRIVNDRGEVIMEQRRGSGPVAAAAADAES